MSPSMNIWSLDNHLRHPWFDPILKKRKRSPPSSSSGSDEWDGHGADFQRPPKKRRCNILEQGFAHLSIHKTPHKSTTDGKDSHYRDQGPSVAEILPENLEYPEEFAMDAADSAQSGQSSHMYSRGSVLLPSSIEEPEPGVPDIQMKTSSWYEPERDRIVITDLDAFESEDDEELSVETQNDCSQISINTTLLERIKNRRLLMRPNAPTSQALILYRPLAVQDGPPPDTSSKEENMNTNRAGALETEEMDVGNEMEVESMDIEFL